MTIAVNNSRIAGTVARPKPRKRIRTILFKRFVACRCIEVFLIYFFRVRYMIREAKPKAREREKRSGWKLSNTNVYRTGKGDRRGISAQSSSCRLFYSRINNNREIGSWPQSHLHSVKAFSRNQPRKKSENKSARGRLRDARERHA